jgi:dihydrodipicolinate synthase/N-acetylneuraminate lyase
MAQPSGAYAPIPTPLDDRGSLDLTALDRHLGFLAEHELDGALILGTNGEFPSFDVGERLALAEAAARFGRGLSLMLGVGSSALPEVVQLVRAARDFGYRSVLVPPPFYFRSAPRQGMIAFFRAVLDAAEIPVLLYHIPRVTGIGISDEILEAVGSHPRFGGVKDSSGEASEIERFAAKLGGRSYMIGNDHLLTQARLAGGSGSITAPASVVPGLVAAALNDSERQGELDAVRSLLEEYGLGPSVKTILRHKGFGAYRTRPPLVDLDDAAAAKLIAEFENLAKT